jgi:hypothetical protein
MFIINTLNISNHRKIIGLGDENLDVGVGIERTEREEEKKKEKKKEKKRKKEKNKGVGKEIENRIQH